MSDILATTRVANAVLARTTFVAPWGVDVGTRNKAAMHWVQAGTCWLRIDGAAEPIPLACGDLVLIARGVRHVLTDAPHTPAEPYADVVQKMVQRSSAVGSAAHTEILCIDYEFEQDDRQPLIELLPALVHLHADAVSMNGPLQALIDLLTHEAANKNFGAALVIPRLVDSLLIFVLRAWLKEHPQGEAGWVATLRDPQIGRAIALMHESPEQRWTVETLAAAVAQSRAVFARRFVERVGEAPLAYLTRWRMEIAANRLRTTDESVERIALQVGYESPTAFGKAFRRQFRISPGRYRALRRTGVSFLASGDTSKD